MKKKYYEYLFLTGAIWNWGVSLFFFLAHRYVSRFLDIAPVADLYLLQLSMALVFAIGLAYYWIRKDPGKNIPVVKLGIAGKTFVFIILSIHAINKNIHPLLVLPGVVDLIYAILFLEFLLKQGGRKR
ncbi:MAG: hypothetical protein JW827_12030 [Spirochaetes bacterium]|nr:hypothetical protein [Spirochaetota bacterium]